MKKVALRTYNREIETLIDQGHTEEAVAHCMHILKSYPKHLETYRLMGKAYLEAHRYAEAADIFLRVLLAVPDDFVSHLGMSIVNDEKHDLNNAIWHMERAFEINSTNGGIQNELRRLYGRRDGVEPARIHLTRGALAQIYMKAGEYQQAISEIKSVLADDAARNDMKTLLARAYYHAGMKNEAVEVCIELLKLYPYSLDGNRILVDILPGTSMAQGVEQYQRRIRSLDPYAATGTGSAFDTQAIPDDAVTIERLEWEPGQNPQDDINVPSVGSEAQPATDIPAWMKQSGWESSGGEVQEEATLPEETSEIAAAEIPDWLKAMAPADAVSPERSKPEAVNTKDQSDENADFEWLAGLGAPIAAQASEAAAPESIDEIGDSHVVPETPVDDSGLDWLNSLGSVSNDSKSGGNTELDWLNKPTQEETSPAQPITELPNWLSDLDKPENTPSANVPDWLKDLSNETSETPAQEIPPIATNSEPAVNETPEWLKSVAPEPAAAETGTLPENTGSADETPDWLKNLISEPPAADATINPASAAPIDETPDWLKNLAAEPAASTVPAAPENPAEIDETPDWLKNLESGSTDPSAQTASKTAPESEAAWMDEFLATPTEPIKEPAPVDDWLDTFEEPTYDLETTSPDVEMSTDDFDRLESVAEGSEPVAETSLKPGTELYENMPADQEEAFKWLENLMNGEPTKPEEPTSTTSATDQKEVELSTSTPEDSNQLVEDLTIPATVEPVSEAVTSDITEEEKPVSSETTPMEQASSADVHDADTVEQLSTEVSTPEQPAMEEIAPAEETPAEAPLSALVTGPGTSAAEQDDALAWLESLAQKQGAKPEELITPAENRSESAPAWLTEQLAPEASKPEQPAMEETAPAEETPAEAPLSALVTGPGTSAAEQDDALAWLESLAQKQGAKPEELITPAENRSESAPAWLTEQPALEASKSEQPAMQEITPAEETPAEAPLSALVTGPGTSAAEQDDALAWLESLAQKQGAKPEELIMPAENRSERAPAWLTEQPAPEASNPEQPAMEVTAPTEETPAEAPLSALVTGPGTSAAEQDDALAWLESLAQKQGAKPEELITPAENRSESAPAWLTEQPALEASKSEQPAMQEITPAEETPAEAPLSALVTGPGTSAAEQDDALAWLESLAQKQGAKLEELITPAENRSESAPAWLTEQPAPEVSQPGQPAMQEITPAEETPAEAPLSALVTGPGTSAAEQDDALAWLESLAQKQGAKLEELITPAENRSESAPAWLTEQPAPEVSQPEQPTMEEITPAEETPAEAPLSALATPSTSASEQDDPLAWMTEKDSSLDWLSESEETLDQLSETQPNKLSLSQAALTQPVSTQHPQAEQEETPAWLGNLSPDAAKPQPEAAAANENDDFDWLGDLSKPLETNLIQPVGDTSDTPEEVQAAAKNLPDAPDVSLEWLSGPTKSSVQGPEQPEPEYMQTPRPEENTTNPDEQADWFSSLEQPDNPKPIIPMPWEQETRPAVMANEGLEPIPAPTEENENVSAVAQPTAQELVSDFVQEEVDQNQTPVSTIQPVEDSFSDEIPAWLTGMDEDEPHITPPLPWEPVAIPPEPGSQEKPQQTDSTEKVEPVPFVNQPDETADWLASLTQEEPESKLALPWEPASDTSDQGEMAPVRSDDVSDWLANLEEDDTHIHANFEAVEPQGDSADISPSSPEAANAEPAQSMPWEIDAEAENTSAAPQANSDISEWLEHLEKQDEEPADPERSESWLTPISAPIQSADSEFEELPDWLKDSVIDETTSEQNTETEQQQVPEQSLEKTDNLPEPAPSKAPILVPATKPIQNIPVPALAHTAPLGNSKDAQAVQHARELLEQNSLSNAMLEYSKIIKKGKLLEDVIYDLKEAVYHHPVDVIVWQTLGDAYFKANRLQEALDAYSKAEGLLR